MTHHEIRARLSVLYDRRDRLIVGLSDEQAEEATYEVDMEIGYYLTLLEEMEGMTDDYR